MDLNDLCLCISNILYVYRRYRNILIIKLEVNTQNGTRVSISRFLHFFEFSVTFLNVIKGVSYYISQGIKYTILMIQYFLTLTLI